MNKLFICILMGFIICILSLTFVSSYPVKISLGSNYTFMNRVYYCNDGEACMKLRPYFNLKVGKLINYTLKNDGPGTKYFIEADYADGFIPRLYKFSIDKKTSKGPTFNEIKFSKVSSCYSSVNKVYANTVKPSVGQKVVVKAQIQSPFLMPSNINIVPFDLRDIYSNKVTSYLFVNDQFIEKKFTNIVWQETAQIFFNYVPRTSGTYKFSVYSYINVSQPENKECITSDWQHGETTLTVS